MQKNCERILQTTSESCDFMYQKQSCHHLWKRLINDKQQKCEQLKDYLVDKSNADSMFFD